MKNAAKAEQKNRAKNALTFYNFYKIVSQFVMDINDCEYDMLDLLAYNCNQLTVQLKESKNPDEQEKILDAYLKKIDKEFEPINEIAEGL